MADIACKQCGTMMAGVRADKVYCTACAADRQRARSREKWRQNKARYRAAAGAEPVAVEVKCVECGKVMPGAYVTRKYCDLCAAERYKAKDRVKKRQMGAKTRRKPAPKPSREPASNAYRVWPMSDNMRSIGRLAAEGRANGLSYGQQAAAKERGAVI